MIHLITGATGNIGSLVVDRLLAMGIRPRVFTRDAEKAKGRFCDRVDIVVGDLEDDASVERSLAGVDVLFLVNSGAGLERRDEAAAAAAKAAGVRRLVKLSSIDARQQNVGTGVWHARGEAAIRASGVPFTFVQPSGFMSNALYWAGGIKAKGVVRSATGDGRIPFIHPHDIADVSVKALTTEDHVGEALGITGPEALTYAEMTAEIAAAVGRDIAYEAMAEEEAREQQVAWRTPPAMVEARLSIFRAIREGKLAEVTDGVERTLGRPALSFRQWARENAGAFRG